jgi:hypothetical protein
MMEGPAMMEDPVMVEADQIVDAAAVQEVAVGHRVEAVVDLLPWIQNKEEK